MAGRKQHFIPKSVLRGFLIDGVGNDMTTWAFVKDRAPFMVSINNFAAQRHFYSEISDSQEETLDDRITQHENNFTKGLYALRNLENGDCAEPRLIGELISHLAIRGAFARDMFKQGAAEMVGLVGENLKNASGMRALLFSDDAQNELPLKKAVREEVQGMRSAGVSLPAGFEDMVVAVVDENFDSAFQFLQPRLVEFLAHFQSTIADAARHGHVRALDHDLVPEAWLVALERMHWRVCDVTDSLILPDCIAVVVDSENRDFMPFLLSGGQSYSKVLMPISSNRMLVGSSAEDFLCEEFNEMAAKCSYSFFVSAVNDNYISVLAPSIGDVSRRFVSSAVADAVSDRFRNME